MKRRMLMVFCVVMTLAVRTALAATFIVEQGRPNAEIVVAKDAPRMTQLGAHELRDYLRKISGAELPVVHAPEGKQTVRIFIGRSEHTDALGITDDGLSHGAFRMVSGDNWPASNASPATTAEQTSIVLPHTEGSQESGSRSNAGWLALLGHDADFEPIEPWAHSHRDRQRAQKEWEELTGAGWRNPMGSVHRSYHGESGLWAQDKGGSLQAVYAFLRELGVRWYMPGELGEVVPRKTSILLPRVDRTVKPDIPYRDLRLGNVPHFPWDDFVWALRLGLNNDGLAGSHGMRAIQTNPRMQKSHPEYFALCGGRRDTETRGSGHACFSSEGLFQETVAFARAVFDHYDTRAVSIFPQDGYRHCQCELCAGKTPSEAVWKFVNRVAIQVYKTHPDHLILCGAYTPYQSPPDTIEKFSPNVVARISWARPGLDSPESWNEYWALVESWKKKLAPRRLMRNFNVPGTASKKFPIIFPHSIAREMRAINGIAIGEASSVPRSPEQRWLRPGLSHLNMYVIARYCWDAEQDLNEMLDEYYTLFYGPAADAMREAFEFAESSYPRNGPATPSRVPTGDRLRFAELVHKARNVAGDTVYGERVQKVIEDLQPLEALRKEHETAEDRGDVREFWTLMPADDREWGQQGAVIDGKLDEVFWTAYPHGGSLYESRTGDRPRYRTHFMMRWYRDHLYVGIRCEDEEGAELNIAATGDGNPAILEGDSVTLLLETQYLSHYEITINPAGAVFDADRSEGGVGARWTAQAEAAAYPGDGYWSAELRIPVVDRYDDPLHNVVGRRPSSIFPWYFNVVRRRIREDTIELFAWEPSGKENVNDPLTFGRIYLRPGARLRSQLRKDGVRTDPRVIRE